MGEEVQARPAAWGGAVSQEPGRGQHRGQEAARPAVRRGGLEGEGEGGGRPREKEQAGPASSWRMSSCSSSSASSPSVHPIATQLQNWVRMNNAMEVMLIPRVFYVLLSPGDYFEWLCEVGKFSTLCNSWCKGPRFLVVTLQPYWPFCRYVQAPLAYPRERKRRINGGQGWLPFFVYCDGFNPETRIEGSLRTLSLCHGSSNFLFIRLLFDKMFPDVRTGHTFARLDVFLLMHFIASCYMLCLLCFMAYHLFLSGEIMIHARIVVSNLHKNAKKSSETCSKIMGCGCRIKDMYLHYNERSGLLLCGFQT
uniref:Uncharacterized protein n=1 Tax=Triticum aestivum TaxID=4565 RepID=A0A077RTP4_WHEAT|nr:unnamed protein product [Triticum aestivum]